MGNMGQAILESFMEQRKIELSLEIGVYFGLVEGQGNIKSIEVLCH
jgi:hypothetical protein